MREEGVQMIPAPGKGSLADNEDLRHTLRFFLSLAFFKAKEKDNRVNEQTKRNSSAMEKNAARSRARAGL
jgi:hypothetical protein